MVRPDGDTISSRVSRRETSWSGRMAIKPRILADYSSDLTDRVVVEREAQSVEELYASKAKCGSMKNLRSFPETGSANWQS